MYCGNHDCVLHKYAQCTIEGLAGICKTSKSYQENQKVPEEAMYPNWKDVGTVHDWRSYVKGDVRDLWDDLPPEARSIIYGWAETKADNEEWD